MADSPSPRSDTGLILRRRFFTFLWEERTFMIAIGLLFLASGLVYPSPGPARWLGFLIAGYAAVANDSIQTLGTFIASNKRQKWWILWLFIGGLFLATVGYSWMEYGGDVSYERLTSKGFEQTPQSFSYLQVAAPIFLLILTRLRMPVSTTFLLLTSFAATAASVEKVLVKSLSGYFLAFGLAIVVWLSVSRVMKSRLEKEAHPLWRPIQWMTTGTLWCVWIMQDAANIAVYLPRQLSAAEFLAFAGFIFGGLGLLFYMRGERIQQIVDEKSGTVDVRSATLIDGVYAFILFYFKLYSKVPMSTTWVFLGLLGGRELAMSLRKAGTRTPYGALRLMGKDALYAGIGLVVSLAIAAAVNPAFQAKLFEMLGFA